MGYEIDINRAGAARKRQELGLATTAGAQGREGASPHYRFYELEPAIVIDVDITNKDASKIGFAKVRPLYSYATVPDTQLPIAVPLDSNVKSYPLKNEVVIVVSYNDRLYYTQRLNLYNLANQNVTNDPFKSFSKDEQNKKDYSQTSAGNPNSPDDGSSENKPGKYFQSSKKVQSLLPMEGDIIYEGRFGNSIRFGGSVEKGTSEVDKRFNNTWAIADSVGLPIIILRSGQKPGGEDKVPYVEDINKDPSSLYITNGHIIPIKVANTNQKSWKGKAPSVYDGNQVIIASDRIVLNAKVKEVLMFANDSIGLSTAKSFLMDVGVETIVNSPKIYLGLDAKERVVLGDKTIDWLKSFVGEMKNLIAVIGDIVVRTGTGPSDPVNKWPANVPNLKRVETALTQLENKLETLLSKQNFTL